MSKRKQRKQQSRMLTRRVFGSKKQKSGTVKKPAAIGYKFRAKNKPFRELRISHTEFISDLTTSASTTSFHRIRKVEVNPGLEESFPWLHGIASNFERYKFNSLQFYYMPSVGTDTDGKIMIAPDYDAADDNTNIPKAKFLSFEDAEVGPVWNPVYSTLSRSNFTQFKSHYIRKRALKPNLDIKTYDIGNVYVYATGVPVNTYVGELYVKFDITFFNPQLTDDNDIPTLILDNDDPKSPILPFITSEDEIAPNKELETDKLKIIDGNKIEFSEPGKYLVDFYSIGTGIVTNYGPTIALGALSVYKNFINSAGNQGTLSALVDTLSVIGPTILNWPGQQAASISDVNVSVTKVPDDYTLSLV